MFLLADKHASFWFPEQASTFAAEVDWFYMAMFYIAPIRNGIVRDLRNKMFGKALDLPLSYYSDERKGDIISRMTTDVVEIEWSIMLTLELIFREPLSIIISVVIMIFRRK